MRYFNRRNRACHHVVTPTIGTSPSQIISASVAASTVMEADALSTSVLILGPRRGVSLLDSLSGRDGFVVAANGASRGNADVAFPAQTRKSGAGVATVLFIGEPWENAGNECKAFPRRVAKMWLCQSEEELADW